MEEQGIPTACISLIRPHSERVKPPRSLWVPFELGRPMGAPNHISFQNEVLISLLNLLERTDGPVILEDYPHDAPEEDDVIPQIQAVKQIDKLAATTKHPLKSRLDEEIKTIRPLYTTALEKRGRTTVGGSGISIESLGDYLFTYINGEIPENPNKDVDHTVSLKLAVEDLKGFYIEAITAQPGLDNLSSGALKTWLWERTTAGETIFELIKTCSQSKDKAIYGVGTRALAPMDVLLKRKDIDLGL